MFLRGKVLIALLTMILSYLALLAIAVWHEVDKNNFLSEKDYLNYLVKTKADDFWMQLRKVQNEGAENWRSDIESKIFSLEEKSSVIKNIDSKEELIFLRDNLEKRILEIKTELAKGPPKDVESENAKKILESFGEDIHKKLLAK